MQRVIFDFDVVSPYSYLAFERLPQALEGVSHWVEYRPFLFAAALKHWGVTAPVDVAPKRAWMFRQATWLAEKEGVAFEAPVPHPFNPLPYLRLLVASAPTGQHPDRLACEQAYRHVWARGSADPTDAQALAALAATMRLVRDPNSDEVKDELKARTADAIQAGVFGVPTFRLDDGQVFWGTDSFEMLVEALKRGETK